MMDELNALIAPKKVVDGLAEVFDGLAQMFAGVSEQLDTLAANAEQEEQLELPVAVQPIPAVSEKKGSAVLHPRKKPDTSAEVITVYKKNTLVEIIQFCDGWLKIKCLEAEYGVAYVLNSTDSYAFTASKIYTVVPGDNLWKIAEKELGDDNRCADIRTLNGLTSNAIRVGMKLLIP